MFFKPHGAGLLCDLQLAWALVCLVLWFADASVVSAQNTADVPAPQQEKKQNKVSHPASYTKVTDSLESMSAKHKNLYYTLAAQLRCPTCSGLSVLQSDAPFSLQIQNTLLEQIQKGYGEREILDFFIQRYGIWILRQPPKRGFHLLAWWIPLLLLLTGPLVLLWSRRGSWLPFLVPSKDTPTSQSKVKEKLILQQMERKLEKMRSDRKPSEQQRGPGP